MSSGADKKNGFLKLIPGGMPPVDRFTLDGRGRRRGRRPGPRVLSAAERDLERRLRDTFVVMKGVGGYPSRGIAAIAQGTATPWRAKGLRVLEALRAGLRGALVRAPAVEFLSWTDEQIARRDQSATTTGEFAA